MTSLTMMCSGNTWSCCLTHTHTRMHTGMHMSTHTHTHTHTHTLSCMYTCVCTHTWHSMRYTQHSRTLRCWLIGDRDGCERDILETAFEQMSVDRRRKIRMVKCLRQTVANSWASEKKQKTSDTLFPSSLCVGRADTASPEDTAANPRRHCCHLQPGPPGRRGATPVWELHLPHCHAHIWQVSGTYSSFQGGAGFKIQDYFIISSEKLKCD